MFHLKLSLCIVVFLLFPWQALGQSRVNISGMVKVTQSGTLYVYLVDKKSFRKPLTGIQKKVIPIKDNTKSNKSIPFIFRDLNPGIYGIRIFLDQNGNKKLDKGLFGPTEPWGMSFHKSRPLGIPSFDEIAIDVTRKNAFISITVE